MTLVLSDIVTEAAAHFHAFFQLLYDFGIVCFQQYFV